LRRRISSSIEPIRSPGQRLNFDCGSPEGFIEANIAFALWRPDLHDHLAALMRRMIDELKPIERRKSAR
jgi:UTP--glucose-1-phosphate uridylyltransferase